MTNESKDNKEPGVRSNLYWNTLIRIPAQAINFAISIIVARILMPRDYGILGITMMLIGYANVFTNFGFNQAIIQKRIFDKKTLDSIFTFDLAVSLLIAMAFFLTSGFIADFFRTPECQKAIKVMSLVFIITSFSALPHAILRRDMNFKAVSILEVTQSILMSSITLGLALAGWRYWALVYGQLVPLSIITLCYCIKANWVPGIYFNHFLMKRVYDFGIWSFLSSQLNFVSGHIDKFIIGRWFGPTNLGFYDKAMSIATIPTTSVLMNINAVMFSSFSRCKSSIGDLREYFEKSLILMSIIIFPIFFGMIAVAPHFVYVLLGKKWSPMIFPFQIISFGLLFKAFGGLTQSLNVGAGRYRDHTIRMGASAGIFLVSCIALLRFGLIGVSVSFVFYSLAQIFLLMKLSLDVTDMTWYSIVKAIMPGLGGSVIMFLVSYTASLTIFSEYSIYNLISIIISGSVSYLFYLVLSRAEILNQLKQNFQKDLSGVLRKF